MFRTRANPDAAIIIVQTRWHHADLVGRLLEQSKEDPGADQWEILHFKALQDNKTLWPERYDLEEMLAIKASVGSRNFEALYQGEPSIAEGNIIKRDWWKTYAKIPHFIRTVHSWDTAFSAKAESNYSVCTSWGVTTNACYLLNVWRGKVDFPELKAIHRMRKHIGWYTRGLPGASKLRRDVVNIGNADQVLDLLQRYSDSLDLNNRR